MNLCGKIALVTGSSKGIGRAIAVELSKAGAVVAVNYNRDLKGAEETLNIIESFGGSGIILQGDVSNYTTSKEIIKKVIERFGKLHILVNNAGISRVGLLIDMTEEDISSLIDTNLKGVINCSHHALKHMAFSNQGCIINISSIWGNVGASCEAVYSATKGGINSFTKALAKEMAMSNIRVNAISPGVINTEMNQWLSEEDKENLMQDIPMSRFGTTDEIGKLAVFLASENASYITGQILTVDGGMT
jgi:3-oxoacyl-[acyl-carrier protein] reductase